MTTILLVDDSPTILLSVTAVLVKAGMEVVTAKDGQEALDRLAAGLQPTLIITDVNMPRLDGLAFVRAARAAGHRFVPIVMFTTATARSKRDEAKAAGATGWVVKPVTAEALLDVIRHVIPAG